MSFVGIDVMQEAAGIREYYSKFINGIATLLCCRFTDVLYIREAVFVSDDA